MEMFRFLMTKSPLIDSVYIYCTLLYIEIYCVLLVNNSKVYLPQGSLLHIQLYNFYQYMLCTKFYDLLH